MIYDLHTHTSISDGKLAPSELVARAKQKQVQVLSITDHDSVDAYTKLNLSDHQAIEIIPGIEFSTYWKKIGVHIVGLNIDLESNTLNAVIQQQSDIRKDRAKQIVSKLNHKHGLDIEFEELKQSTNTDNLGRPHIAEYLIAHKHAKNFQHAFDKFLSTKKLGDIKYQWLTLDTVVETITASGGVAIIAHPLKYKLTYTKLLELINDFKAYGGQAIEVISGRQDPNHTKQLLKIAQQTELYASCGSDFHQPDIPWTELGQFGQLPKDSQPVWELFD